MFIRIQIFVHDLEGTDLSNLKHIRFILMEDVLIREKWQFNEEIELALRRFLVEHLKVGIFPNCKMFKKLQDYCTESSKIKNLVTS